MADVVVYGTGDVARLVHAFLTHDSPHRVVAFCLDRDRITESRFLDLPLVAFDTVTDRYPPATTQMMIAVGFQRVNEVRAEKFHQAKEMGYHLARYVSSSATVWRDVPMGENCIVMERNVIQPFARIGDDVILGPANSIGHHVEIGDHAFLASQVDLSGRVVVEERCFLGANATVRDGIRIGRSSVIGANVQIMKDTAERQVYHAPRPRLLRLPSDKLPRI